MVVTSANRQRSNQVNFNNTLLAKNVLSKISIGTPVSYLKYLSLMEKAFVGAYDADLALNKLNYYVDGDTIKCRESEK